MRSKLFFATAVTALAVSTGVAVAAELTTQTTANKALNATAKRYHETCHIEYNTYYGQQVSVCAKGNPAWHAVKAPKNGKPGTVDNEQFIEYGYALQQLKADQKQPAFADYYFVIYSYPTTDDKGRELLNYDVAGFRNADIGF